MPLTTTASASGEDLLGGANSPAASGHVTVTRVLVKGEPVASPAGRGDDFSWPRGASVAALQRRSVVATTTLPLPIMQAAPAKTTVMAPSVESPAIAVAHAAPRRPQQPRPQPQRAQPAFPFFQFFR